MILLDEESFCEEELMLEEEIFCEDELAFDERFFSVAEDEDFLDVLLLALDEELADFSMLLETMLPASLSGFATDDPFSLHAMNNITASEIISLLFQKLIHYSFIGSVLISNIKNKIKENLAARGSIN